MKKILLIGIVGTFVFAGVNFNKGVEYGGLDKDAAAVELPLLVPWV